MVPRCEGSGPTVSPVLSPSQRPPFAVLTWRAAQRAWAKRRKGTARNALPGTPPQRPPGYPRVSRGGVASGFLLVQSLASLEEPDLSDRNPAARPVSGRG